MKKCFKTIHQFSTCPAQASEEEMAEVEAATKQLLDTRGGKLSPLCEVTESINDLKSSLVFYT